MTNSPQTKIIIICGPTGTGKSFLALNLCRRYHGAIISADSRQVYQNICLGTGKEISSETYNIQKERHRWLINNIPVYGYDIVPLDSHFSVSGYEKEVFTTFIPEIIKEKQNIFLVGGTGLYIKSIIDGIDTISIPPDLKLRQKLEKLQKRKGTAALFQKLHQKFPLRASQIDPQNPHRIIRAYEIAEAYEKGFIPMKRTRNFDLLLIGLTYQRQELYSRIDQRVDFIIANGLISEIESLLSHKIAWNFPAMKSIGYIEFEPYFNGEKSLSECVECLKFNTHAYARRQLTWFKKDPRIKWFDLNEKTSLLEIDNLIAKFLELK